MILVEKPDHLWWAINCPVIELGRYCVILLKLRRQWAQVWHKKEILIRQCCDNWINYLWWLQPLCLWDIFDCKYKCQVYAKHTEYRKRNLLRRAWIYKCIYIKGLKCAWRLQWFQSVWNVLLIFTILS
jgi:hypothetical protein